MILNKQKIFLSLFTASFLFLISCTGNSRQQTNAYDLVPMDDASVLRVAIGSGVPGFFEFNGQPMGYVYDLLESYGRSFGKSVEISSVAGPQEHAQALLSGQIGLAATIHPGSFPEARTVIPLYETSYVLLATTRKMRSRSGQEVFEWLNGQHVVFSEGFSATRTYDELHDQAAQARLEPSAKNTFVLLEDLINNRIDFLICERSEALLGTSLIHNIRTVSEFDEKIPVYAVLQGNLPEEGRRFTSWLYGFQQSRAARELHNQYFEKGIAQKIISGGVKNRPSGSTSVYDTLFKQLAAEENLDWRLVSAIAFSESKYNPYLVSPRGARGLMQVMPATARAFNVQVDDLMDPEANVRVAIKLIRQIEKSLKFAPGTSQEDRTSIMLACYNGGIGHVTDARRLAVKYGANPDSWADVLHYLQLKSRPEYAEDDLVKCGTFNGAGETRKFVSHVMGKYYAYSGK